MRPITDELRGHLRRIQVDSPDIDLDLFPDFLLLGPQRTGSSWLHSQLARHPQTLTSVPKEIFYFSTLGRPQQQFHVSDDLGWYLKHFRTEGQAADHKRSVCQQNYQMDWDPRVRGESTASYAVAIDAELAAEIRLLQPDLRCILTIREPVDRTWSHMAYGLGRRGQKPEDLSEAEIEDLLDAPYLDRCNHSCDLIAKWRELLKTPEHLLVAQFDHISTRPAEFLGEVFRFLGIDDDERYVWEDVRRVINPSQRPAIPPRLELKLQDRYRDEKQRLADEHGIVFDS